MPPSFTCQVCGAAFELNASAVAKYPGWSPKYCRAHSPTKARKEGQVIRPLRGSPREENLTLAQVLERYEDGPQDGVFTDGSAQPNPGPGGWGFVWIEAGQIRKQAHGKDAATTNNRMELRALIEAFKQLPADAEVTVHTDSKLCVDTITKWAPNWERKAWTKKGGPIKNLELVQELLGLSRSRPRCKLQWIAAHSGKRWNEYADSLASAWQRDQL